MTTTSFRNSTTDGIADSRRVPGWRHVSGRDRLAGLLLVLSACITAISFCLERFEPWLAVPALLLAATGLRLIGWWTRHPTTVVVVTVNLIAVFVYLWTLGESLTVTVQATNHGYVAHIGGTTLVASTPPHAGRLVLVAGDASSYRVQTTGEAPFPAKPNWLGEIGQSIRFAAPEPAWSDVVLIRHATRQALGMPPYRLAGAARENVRGEWESSGGAWSYAPVLTPPYTVTANLMRPDGAQGLLLGLTQDGQAVYLQVRMDRPDASWILWSTGQPVADISGAPLRPGLLEMTQRVLRLVLGTWIAALVLCFAVLGASLLLSYLLPPAPINALGRYLDPRVLSQAALWATIGVAAAGATCAAALVAQGLLGAIPHVQDDVAYVFQAKTLALGHLSVPAPTLPGFFSEQFVDTYRGQWFGKYPPGWPLLLAVGELAGHGWLVNPILTGVDLMLIFLIGKEAYGEVTGILAALLVLASPFFLVLGGTFMAHTATLAYLAGATWLLLRWVNLLECMDSSPRRWLLPLSGFLYGLAFITRQVDTLACALPFVLMLRSRPVRAALMRDGLLALALAAVPVAAMGLYDWHLTGSPFLTPYEIWSPMDRLGFGPSVLYDPSPAQGLHNTSLNLAMLMTDLFGWPFYLTLAPALLPFVLGRLQRWDVVFALSTVCLIGVYVFYWGTGIMYGPRYYYVAIPWLALLTARGLEELIALPARLPGWVVRHSASGTACLLLLGALLCYNLVFYLPSTLPIYRGYNFTSPGPLDAMHATRLRNALVFTVSHPAWAWWSYGEVFFANSPMLDGDVVFARDRGNADSRLMHLFPGRHYYRLEGTRLTRIAP